MGNVAGIDQVRNPWLLKKEGRLLADTASKCSPSEGPFGLITQAFLILDTTWLIGRYVGYFILNFIQISCVVKDSGIVTPELF